MALTPITQGYQFWASFRPHYRATELADITDNLATLADKFIQLPDKSIYYVDTDNQLILAFDTVGRPVFMKNNPTKLLATATTNNAVPQSMVIFPLATGESVIVKAVFAAAAGDYRMIVEKTAFIKNIGGTLSFVGTETEGIYFFDPELETAKAVIDIEDTDIIFTLTGVDATDIDWSIFYFLEKQ
jgi:hypothetical protein